MPVEAGSSEGRRSYLRFLKVSGIIQIALGIAHLICGALAAKYTERQTDSLKHSVGPPYFVGAFMDGILMTIAGVVSLMICKKAVTLDTDKQDEVQDFSCFMCAEQVLCIATCIGSSIGIFFVSIFGLRDCGASDCSFTENIPENMTIAGVILSLLLISAVVSMIIVCCSCRSASQFGVSFKQQRRSLVVRGGTQVPLTTRQATNMPIDTASAYKYSSIAVGGATQNTAAEHAPSDDMVLQCEPQTTGQTIQELREQNRHLQEQLRLQQEQMALQQQLRQLAGQAPPTATPIYMPPPPSYEEVTSDESLLRQSEAHDEELKHHIQ